MSAFEAKRTIDFTEDDLRRTKMQQQNKDENQQIRLQLCGQTQSSQPNSESVEPGPCHSHQDKAAEDQSDRSQQAAKTEGDKTSNFPDKCEPNAQCTAKVATDQQISGQAPEVKLAAIEEKLAHIEKQLEKTAAENSGYIEQLQSCLEVTARCQQSTSQIVNDNMQRHALEPAVKALAAVVCSVSEIASHEVFDNKGYCRPLDSLSQSVAGAQQMAAEKLDSLDIEIIRPSYLDDFDPQLHQINTTVAAADKDAHARISRTLVPGLIYRGKILKTAKVSVFRYQNQSKQDR